MGYSSCLSGDTELMVLYRANDVTGFGENYNWDLLAMIARQTNDKAMQAITVTVGP